MLCHCDLNDVSHHCKSPEVHLSKAAAALSLWAFFTKTKIKKGLGTISYPAK